MTWFGFKYHKFSYTGTCINHVESTDTSHTCNDAELSLSKNANFDAYKKKC